MPDKVINCQFAELPEIDKEQDAETAVTICLRLSDENADELQLNCKLTFVLDSSGCYWKNACKSNFR